MTAVAETRGNPNLAPAPTLSSSSQESVPPVEDRPFRHATSRPHVYVTRRIPQRGMDVLLQVCDVKQWDAEQAVPRGEFLHSVVGAEAILCMQSDAIDADVLEAAGPNLKVIATMTNSTQHIDMEECHRRGIQVLPCPLQPLETQAELTVTLILLTMKESQTDEERLINFDLQPPDVISGSPDTISTTWLNNRPRVLRRMSEEKLAFQWNNGKPGNTNCSTWKNIAKKTFGIYGITDLGQCLAKTLKSTGVVDVLMADKDAELDNSNISLSQSDVDLVSFDEFLKRSDIICVCGSAGELSQEIFSRESFQKMKRDAIVITSQSEERAVDYMDLYVALRDGQIRAAGLNDCNQEAVPCKILLQGLKNCIFLPQTQESVYDMRHKVSTLIAKNLTQALNQLGAN